MRPLTQPLRCTLFSAALSSRWAAVGCSTSSDSADLLGAVIGINTAAMARQLHEKLGGANGLFGAFFRRVGSAASACKRLCYCWHTPSAGFHFCCAAFRPRRWKGSEGVGHSHAVRCGHRARPGA